MAVTTFRRWVSRRKYILREGSDADKQTHAAFLMNDSEGVNSPESEARPSSNFLCFFDFN